MEYAICISCSIYYIFVFCNIPFDVDYFFSIQCLEYVYYTVSLEEWFFENNKKYVKYLLLSV